MWKHRKDSFITHRAFCDALNEENSRMASFPMMSTGTNFNFRHDLIMSNSGGGGGLRFPGMFNGGMLEVNLDTNTEKPKLPMWLDQNVVNESHIENPNTSSFLGSSSSYHNNNGGIMTPEMVQWLTGNHEPSTGTYMGSYLKEEDQGGKQEMAQFGSLYNYTNSTAAAALPSGAVAHMSATALLQKATQMGSTRSTTLDDDSVGLGLMSTTSFLNYDSSNNNHENGDHGLMMMMKSKGVKDRDLTRDFLGVGGDERRSFDLQEKLLKFSSSMED